MATHSRFTEEELAFIINYDTRLRRSGFGGQVKYRMGLSGDQADRDGGESEEE